MPPVPERIAVTVVPEGIPAISEVMVDPTWMIPVLTAVTVRMLPAVAELWGMKTPATVMLHVLTAQTPVPSAGVLKTNKILLLISATVVPDAMQLPDTRAPTEIPDKAAMVTDDIELEVAIDVVELGKETETMFLLPSSINPVTVTGAVVAPGGTGVQAVAPLVEAMTRVHVLSAGMLTAVPPLGPPLTVKVVPAALATTTLDGIE